MLGLFLIFSNILQCVTSGAFQQWQIDRNQSPEDHKKDDMKEEKADKRDERRKKAAGGKVGGGTQVLFHY